MLPSGFEKYFWDVDVKSVDPVKNPLFVIQRLLNKGDRKSVAWVLDNFGEKEIKDAFATMRDFSPKIGKFWQLFLGLPEEKVLCLQKPYQKVRKSHWPF